MLNQELKTKIELIGQARTVNGRLQSTPGVQKLPAPGLDIYVVPNFLGEAERLDLVQRSDRTLLPSTVLGEFPDPDYRTSRSGNLDPHDPFVIGIDRRIAALLGLDPTLGETIQGQRYDVGQQFKGHMDYFHTTMPYWESQRIIGGQRSWTAMVFLVEPQAGGATNFPDIGIKVAPKAGTLLTWNNMDANGEPNENSKHQGMPVEAGTKYIITKWFRERPWGVWFDPLNPGRTVWG